MEKYFTIQTDSSGDEWWYIMGQDGKWYRGWLIASDETANSDNDLFWFNFNYVPGVGF